MDIESQLHEKILVLQRALPRLKVFQYEMWKMEAYLQDATDHMKKVTGCIPFVQEQEALARVKMLATKCCLKRLMVNSANTKIEEVLSLVTEPDTLLELVMEKVVQINLPMEDLPKTLVAQLLEWPSKRTELVGIKLFIIEDMLADMFDELQFIFG